MSFATMWIVLGIMLLVAEMLTGTFVLVFFALGAFISALVAAFAPDLIAAQLIANAVISFTGALLLRKPLQRKLLKSAQNHQIDLGKEITIDQPIPAHQQTRISYQGTTWQASNVGTDDIHHGDRVTIVGMDNLTLLVKKN